MNVKREQLLLYALTDRSWLKPGESLAQVVEILLQNGVTCLQLRDKGASHQAIVAEAERLLPICRRYGVPLIINDDVEAAAETGADGVHVGQSDMAVTQARAILGPDKIIGTSAHNVAEALAAQKAGADYLGSGAVFGSSTKTDVGTLPLEEFSAICHAVELPVVAIGGISRENIAALSGLGMAGAAVISALLAQDDKAFATREMLALATQAVQANQ